MDIQPPTTPKKNHRPTPNQQTQSYQSPERVHKPMAYETPKKDDSHVKKQRHSTFQKKENPESKKGIASSRKEEEECLVSETSAFELSRLEQDYIFIRKLGCGNFSRVGLYQSRLSLQEFAIKETEVSMMSINEVQALGTLSLVATKSKNVIKYFHSWVEDKVLYLVMEYCNSSLAHLIEKQRMNHTRISESEIKNVMRQALEGLRCLHGHEMAHLDIKPDNLLFQDKILKISDLGLCRVKRIQKSSSLDEGDSRYLAKEVLNFSHGVDLSKSDIFSLGMTLYQIISLEHLPNNGEQWRSVRQKGLKIKGRMDLQEYSEQLLSWIQRMTESEWSARPSAEEMLRSGYLRECVRRRNMFGEERSSKKKEASL